MDIKNILRILREQVSGRKSYRLGKLLAQGRVGDFPGPVNIPALQAGLTQRKTGTTEPLNVISAFKLGQNIAKHEEIVPNFPKGMRYFNPILRNAIMKGFTKGTKNAPKS